MQIKELIGSFLTRLRSPRPSRPQSSGSREPTVPEYPWGLNQEQVDSLRQLLSTPQWRTYTVALQAVSEHEFQKLLSGLEHREYLVLCGRIQSRLEVLTLPDTLDQKARDIDEHRRKSADTADAAKQRSKLAFAGSPYFGNLTDRVTKPSGEP